MITSKVFREVWKTVSKGSVKSHHEAKLTALILIRKLPQEQDLIIRACKLRVATQAGLASVEKIKSGISKPSGRILFSKYFDSVNNLMEKCDLVGQYLTIPDNHKKKKKAILDLSLESSDNPEAMRAKLDSLEKMENGNLGQIMDKKDIKTIKKDSFKVKDSRLKLNTEIDNLASLIGSKEALFSIAPFLNTKV